MKKAYFAGGCFWCIASVFDQINGIIHVSSGFSGGNQCNPTYEDVKKQLTNHRETICIEYDENIISYSKLVSIFLNNVDPFDNEGQFIDKGFSYTLAIFYLDDNEKEICLSKINNLENKSNQKVYISVLPYKNFYIAEEYHQDYSKKNVEEFKKEYEQSGRKQYFQEKENYVIKKVEISEINDVMEIINDAIKLLGVNSLQWQQGYPNINTMRDDINNNNLFGAYDDGILIGIVALVKGIDKSYINIYEGKWLKDVSENDLVIHRIAVKNEYHGKHIGQLLTKYAIEYSKSINCTSIKADTHVLNEKMKHLLLSNGFSYRGIIYLARDEKDNSRLAYELIISGGSS